MSLKILLLRTRAALADLSVKVWPEPILVDAINEGKNEAVRLMRSPGTDFFLTPVTVNFTVVAAGLPSEITLPNDFAEFKDLTITQANYTAIQFTYLNRSHQTFLDALRVQTPTADGLLYYFDIIGRSTLQAAPGFTVACTAKLYYVATVPDMVKLTDTPTLIPTENWDFIVAYAVCEAMRSRPGGPDPRLASWENKLKTLGQNLYISAINRRVPEETKFAQAYEP